LIPGDCGLLTGEELFRQLGSEAEIAEKGRAVRRMRTRDLAR